MKKTSSETANRCMVIVLLILLVLEIKSQNSDSHMATEDIKQKKSSVFFIDFYQRHLSPLRGSRCPMYPSCSEYARGVIERYAPLQTYPLICDRLLRCGHDFATYTDTIIDQRLRWIDFPNPKLIAPVLASWDYSDTIDLSSFCEKQALTMQTTGIPSKGVNSWIRQAHHERIGFINSNAMTLRGSLPGDIDSTAVRNEADFLYRNGFYEQAYLESVRSLSHERDSATILQAAFAAYHAYDYRRFTREIDLLIKLLPEKQSNLPGELYLLAAKRYYTEGMYPAAYTVLEKKRLLFNTPVLYGEYRLLANVTALFCNIDTVPHLTNGDFPEGSPLVRYSGRIDSLSRALDNLRPRSVAAAGFLSALVPGSGYALGDRKRTALFALLFNGLLAWSTIEFVRQENYGAAMFSVLLGSGFYIGSIAGSMRAVDLYNLRNRQSLIKRSLYDLDVDP